MDFEFFFGLTPDSVYFAALGGVVLGFIFHVRHPVAAMRGLVTMLVLIYATFFLLQELGRFLNPAPFEIEGLLRVTIRAFVYIFATAVAVSLLQSWERVKYRRKIDKLRHDVE